MSKKYYLTREFFWEKEVERGKEIDEGIDVLLEIDSLLVSAFDILEYDKYGEMKTYSYSSERKEIEKCRNKNDDLINYARKIHGTLEDKENDFLKQISKALEELSKLNINDYQVDNILGITEVKEVSMVRDSEPITIEQKKSKITYADIMGKTDMMGLSKQFKEYVNIQRSNQKLSEAEISRLKEEYYEGVLTTSFEHGVYNDGWFNSLSETLDYIPIIGGVKNIVEGVVGYSLTGEKLSEAERLQYGVLGIISSLVDVVTLGSGAVLTQGTKVAVKTVGKSFVKTTVLDVSVGYGTKFITNGLMDLGMSPEMTMGIHILTNLAYMGYNKVKVSNGTELFSPKNVLKQRTGGLDLRAHPSDIRQLSSKKMSELKIKIDARKITKDEYVQYIWNQKISSARKKAVKDFWIDEIDRIAEGNPTRRWTPEQIKDIQIGKIPTFDGKTMVGHHSYSVSDYPHLAGNSEVIWPVTFNEHFNGWHGGNWSTSLPGKPIIEIDDFKNIK